jgi:hypothetical protein
MRTLKMLATIVAVGFTSVRLVASAKGPSEGDVVIGGEMVLRLRVGAGTMSAGDRADAIQARLVKFLSDPDLQSKDIITSASGRDHAIKIKQDLLVTVTQQDARANKTTPQKLAESWVAHLRKVLPKLKVQPLVPKK